MKTVKGEIFSTTPISLSRAALILFKFVSADNGASQAVCAYLRRASFSFCELNQLHKELKSQGKRKNPISETVTDVGEESPRQNHKKKKEERGKIVEDKGRIKIEESDLGVEDEKKKHKKKRGEIGKLEGAKGNVKIEEDGNVGIEDNDRKKHRKNKGENGGKFGFLEEEKNRIKIEEDGDMGMDIGRKEYKIKRETSEYLVTDLKENGGKVVVKEEEEKNKKRRRKSGEIEEGTETNSGESRSKKKKKRKTERES